MLRSLRIEAREASKDYLCLPRIHASDDSPFESSYDATPEHTVHREPRVNFSLCNGSPTALRNTSACESPADLQTDRAFPSSNDASEQLMSPDQLSFSACAVRSGIAAASGTPVGGKTNTSTPEVLEMPLDSRQNIVPSPNRHFRSRAVAERWNEYPAAQLLQ